jgi:hypothetical protein
MVGSDTLRECGWLGISRCGALRCISQLNNGLDEPIDGHNDLLKILRGIKEHQEITGKFIGANTMDARSAAQFRFKRRSQRAGAVKTHDSKPCSPFYCGMDWCNHGIRSAISRILSARAAEQWR